MVYVLHSLLHVFHETVGVLMPPGVAGPEVENADFPVADFAEPQASVYIAVAFDFLVPVSLVSIEVDSPGRPRFFPFPSIDYSASPSSSVEVVGEKSVHSSTGVRSNYGLCSILSNLGLNQNKSLEHCYNKPNPGHNIVSDTNHLHMDATTNHSRKTCLPLYQEQSTHRSPQASLPHPEVPQIRWVAERFQHLNYYGMPPYRSKDRLSYHRIYSSRFPAAG